MRLWRRAREVDLHLRMHRIEHLFEEPHLDPFAPDQEAYDTRAGLERMLSAVRRAKRKAPVSVTVELPPEAITPQLEDRASAALNRECRRKLAVLDDELEAVWRLGIKALLWGILAVMVLNGLAGAIGDQEAGSLEEAVASGLSVASWVILWVPVNLLVYDRWYYRRDRRAYRRLRDLPLTVVPIDPAGDGTRSGP